MHLIIFKGNISIALHANKNNMENTWITRECVARHIPNKSLRHFQGPLKTPAKTETQRHFLGYTVHVKEEVGEEVGVLGVNSLSQYLTQCDIRHHWIDGDK